MPFTVRIERARDRPDTQSIMYGPLLYPILGTIPANQGGYQNLTLYRHLKLDGDYGRAAVTKAAGMNMTAGGLSLRPHYVGDTQPHSPFFRRIEPNIVFGSVDTGVPNVKRDDDLPNYDVPVTGITSPGNDGLTFLDIVWDDAPFASHAAFVAKVTAAADFVRRQGHADRRAARHGGGGGDRGRGGAEALIVRRRRAVGAGDPRRPARVLCARAGGRALRCCRSTRRRVSASGSWRAIGMSSTACSHPDLGHQLHAYDPVNRLEYIDSRQLINLDPPDHTRLRALVNRAFTPRTVAGLEARIGVIVDALIDARRRGEIDGVRELGEPMPVAVIAELIGVPAADRAMFRGVVVRDHVRRRARVGDRGVHGLRGRAGGRACGAPARTI